MGDSGVQDVGEEQSEVELDNSEEEDAETNVEASEVQDDSEVDADILALFDQGLTKPVLPEDVEELEQLLLHSEDYPLAGGSRSRRDIAGLKAAKEQYYEAKKAAKATWDDAKAQLKAATKALIKSKFSKGSKSKGEKAIVPTIHIRYETTCEDEPRQKCVKTPRQDCHKEVVPVCKTEPREVCVDKEKCTSWPKKNCDMVHKETCLPFPAKKCVESTTSVCKIVPRKECAQKKQEICETRPIKECTKQLVKKPRTVCIPKPTIRTVEEEDW